MYKAKLKTMGFELPEVLKPLETGELKYKGKVVPAITK